MNKEQIKSLIQAKIVGQGNQINSGSDVPIILNAIIDLIVEGGASTQEIDDFEEFDEGTNYAKDDIVRRTGKLFIFTADKDAGAWDADKVEQVTVYDLLSSRLPVMASVDISALQSANLTAEEAAAAGFDALTIQALQQADNPTVHFNDMCVTFNGVEVISDDLVNQSALVVHTAVGGGTLHKCILSLYTDGRVVYTVTDIQ